MKPVGQCFFDQEAIIQRTTAPMISVMRDPVNRCLIDDKAEDEAANNSSNHPYKLCSL